MISYYLETDVLPTKCIVLLVHGWLGTPNSMDDLTNAIDKLSGLKASFNYTPLDITLSASTTIVDSSIAAISSAYCDNEEANVFVKVGFTDDENGLISAQTSELFTVISVLKVAFPDKKIVTVGYSKGGVVSMNCAIEHPGYIDKLISIGTPYTTTIAEHLYDILADVLVKITGAEKLINIISVNFVTKFIYKHIASKLIENSLKLFVDSFLEGRVTLSNLKNRWNALENKPSFTPIALSTLSIFYNNANHYSDIIVPVSSALAQGFDGKSYSDESLLLENENTISINSNKICDNTSFADLFFDTIESFISLSEQSEDVTTSNFVGKITYLANILIYINGLDFASCNYYAHTRIGALSITNYCLDYTLVGMRVLAGLVV